MRRRRSEPRPCVRATSPDFDSEPHCRAATDSRRCPIVATRANRISVGLANAAEFGRCSATSPFRIRIASTGRVATEIVNRHQSAADYTRAEIHAMRRKQRSIRRGVKIGDHSLVRIRRSCRVGAEGEIENRRMLRKARTAAQDLRKRHVVGPDKGHAIVKSLEPVLELLTPNRPSAPEPITMNTCLVSGSTCRMSSTSLGKSLTTATAASFSTSGASPRNR